MDWKAIVGTVAPSIATALGGPLAGVAVAELGRALGLAPNPTEDQVAAAVRGATPDDLLKIKQADQAFAVKMRELDVDLARVAAGDRDSARRREVDSKDWTPKVLAFLVVLLYIAVQWFLLTRVVHDDMREMVMRALGTLDASVGLVLAYYFGASATNGQAPPPPVKK